MRTSSALASMTTALLLVATTGCSNNTPPPSDPTAIPPESSSNTPPAPAQPSGEQTAPANGAVPSRSSVAEGGMCGGIAGFTCAKGLFCSFSIEARCGAADQTGVCRAVPEMCTEQYEPVCGCNERTYSNACHAARDGVSVAAPGECKKAPELPEGATCGSRGIAGECAADLYCDYVRNCGADDSGGTCKKRTEMCTRIYAPVCGCDGKTYGNACTAAGAGVSVASKGECKP